MSEAGRNVDDIDDDEETAGCESDEDMDDAEDEKDDDTIAACVKDDKRKSIVVLDEADEGFAPSKSPKRHQKDALSRGRKAALPDGIDPESDSDAYVGPKHRKPAGAATRSSLRKCQFAGSYKVSDALGSKFEDE